MISGSATRVVHRYCYLAVLGAISAWMLAGCSGLVSSSSGLTPDTTPPTAPTNLTATATLATQINLSWTASTDNVAVTGYKVERCAGAGCASFAQIATPVSAGFNDSGLSASTAYSYRVRAVDAAGNNSAYSNVFSDTTPAAADTTPPNAPTNLAATAASASQINLSWAASTDNVGVTGYKVERCTGAACANFVQIATPTGTTFNDTGLTASTSYSYRVRANDAAGNNSVYSNTASVTTQAAADTTPPSAPTNLTATAASSTQINLSWTASTDSVGVTGYKVERCSGAGCANFTQIGTPTTTTFNDTGLTASTSYSYRVRANDAAGNNSAYSNVASATTPATADTTPPTAPTNLTATAASTSQINLAWTASTDNVGVTGYKVERCSGAGCANFVQIATPTGTTFNDTALTASTSYYYRVRANDAAGNNSAYSNVASATTPAAADTTPPTAPTNLTATVASTSQINLAWTASTDNVGVTGYKVERCSGAACVNFAQIATPTATTFNDTGLTASTSYSYRVRANDAAGNNSAYSNTASATTPAAPGNISVTISPRRGGLTISQTMPFTATVTNDVGSAGVTWTSSGGGFSAQSTSAATFVAPNLAGVVTVTATSVADGTKSAMATIGVTDLAGVVTYHNDLSRDGVNAQEYALTTANVATATFGKLFSCATDGAMYAQPLWVENLPIQGGTHNVILGATTHDTVYAFDADTNPCVTYWSKSLLGSGETYVSSSDVGTGDIQPDVGIIGTPVIDPATNTLYVVSKSKTSGSNCTPATSCFQRLHALSLIDGTEKFGGPVNITSAISVPGTGDGSAGGNVTFNTLRENQRPGLVLSGGVIYVAWASHGDNGPYHGWVIGFNASTLAIAGTFNANPNGSDSGIWMSGGAPAADSSGNLYFLTGNGTFDANSGGSDYGDSTVKLSTSGGLSVASYFTPADQQNLEGGDTDHGSGGAAILVDQPMNAPHQHLLIGGGKEGNFFLLNRDNLGGYGANANPVDTNAVQKFSEGNGLFATAAFFNNALYIAGAGGHLKSFAFNTGTGQFNAAQTSQSTGTFGFPGSTPSVSASGTTNGIVWAMNNNAYCTQQSPSCGPAVLHAYDATNLATELWNSSQNAGDAAGNAVKFTVPTVANGKVYIGTRGNDAGNGGTTVPGEVDVYGLKPN
jgi:chitodextrinase